MDAAFRYQFPTTLTHQRRFCGLPMDEVVVYLPLIICTIFVNMWIFAPALAVAFVGLRRLKQGKGSSYLLGLAYWCLPTSIMRFFITVLPESFKRSRVSQSPKKKYKFKNKKKLGCSYFVRLSMH